MDDTPPNHDESRTVNPRLLTVDGAAQYLGGIHRTTIYDLVTQGHLKPVKVGRRTMFDRHDLDTYIEERKAATAP